MATYDYSGYDDDQITWPGGSPSVGDTITFTQATDHTISITDSDTKLEDGTDDRDDEDSSQTAIVYDELGDTETSGQVQPRREVELTDGTDSYFMTEVFIAATNSYYWIFQDPPPELGVEYTVKDVDNPTSTAYADLSTAGIVCFVAGTLIATPAGARPVETLGPGDAVLTLDNGPQPLLWTGARRVSHAEMRAHKGLRPFLVRAGALGPGQPARDTGFSRQHRVLLAEGSAQGRGALAPVHTLAALPGIEQTCPPAGARFVHLLTRSHNLIWSNGLVSETLLVTPYSSRVSGIGLVPPPGLCPGAAMRPARPILPNRQARALAERLACRAGRSAPMPILA